MMRVTLPVMLLLAGCVPLLTVTQPEAEILVTDENGVPIEGARLNFATQLYGPGGSTEFVSVKTDQSGIVRLARESYIQIALLAADGVAIYGWSYCIEKAGFQPAVRNHLDKKHFRGSLVQVPLTRSDSGGNCTWNEDWVGFYSAVTG